MWSSSVAPFAGAWIEMLDLLDLLAYITVAPFAGAWIEINNQLKVFWLFSLSHPSRVRGLKYKNGDTNH